MNCRMLFWEILHLRLRESQVSRMFGRSYANIQGNILCVDSKCSFQSPVLMDRMNANRIHIFRNDCQNLDIGPDSVCFSKCSSYSSSLSNTALCSCIRSARLLPFRSCIAFCISSDSESYSSMSLES